MKFSGSILHIFVFHCAAIFFPLSNKIYFIWKKELTKSSLLTVTKINAPAEPHHQLHSGHSADSNLLYLPRISSSGIIFYIIRQSVSKTFEFVDRHGPVFIHLWRTSVILFKLALIWGWGLVCCVLLHEWGDDETDSWPTAFSVEQLYAHSADVSQLLAVCLPDISDGKKKQLLLLFNHIEWFLVVPHAQQ